MKKITLFEASQKVSETPTSSTAYMNGYNTAVDEAEKVIAELKQQLKVATDDRGKLSNILYEKLFAELENDDAPQPSSDWHTKHLTAHIDFDERLMKLEESCIMDGEVVLIHGIGNKLITKVK